MFLLSLALLAVCGTAGAHGGVDIICRAISVPVPIAAGGPELYQLRGDLCAPRRRTPRVVQVLLHGATFDRRYWDPGVERNQHSYVLALARAGYAVLGLDRLGNGASDHPASPIVTVDAQVEALHAIVGKLRRGDIGGVPFQRVATVGHSLGSIIAILEAGTYGDVDGLILSGFSHALAAEAQQRFGAALIPAALDPAFASLGLDAGYFTTSPGARADLFLSDLVTPAFVRFDEATKGIVTVGEFAPSTLGDPSAQIRQPILLVAGKLDPFACPGDTCSSSRALEEHERRFFTAAQSLRAVALPLTGHAVAYAETAPLWLGAAVLWSDRHLGGGE